MTKPKSSFTSTGGLANFANDTFNLTSVVSDLTLRELQTVRAVLTTTTLSLGPIV